jgi:2-dehydropantoate 2-reductase
MRHAILGAGGVGGFIGACLAKSGASVTMVVRPESLAHYPAQLQLESAVWKLQRAGGARGGSSARRRSLDYREGHATGSGPGFFHESRLGEGDRSAAERHRPSALHCARDTVRSALLRRRLPSRPSASRPATLFIALPLPRLNVSSAGRTLLGTTLDELQKMGFECRFIDHEPTLMWSKLVFLAAFALTTTAGDKTTGEILGDPTWRQLGLSCIREASAVAVAEGAKIDADAVIAGGDEDARQHAQLHAERCGARQDSRTRRDRWTNPARRGPARDRRADNEEAGRRGRATSRDASITQFVILSGAESSRMRTSRVVEGPLVLARYSWLIREFRSGTAYGYHPPVMLRSTLANPNPGSCVVN